MAEDPHKEGFEEDKKQNSGSKDDDDFGLPDLEFEELEELDLDLDDDSSEVSQVKDDSSSAALDEGIDEVEDVLDSAQLISDRLGDDSVDENSNNDGGIGEEENSELETIDNNFDDQNDDLNDISSPDELAALGIADEDDGNSTESLFSADENDSSDSDVFGSDSDFDGDSIFTGDVNLKQEEKIEFEAAEDAELPPTYKPYSDEESKGGFAKVIIFGAIAFTLIGFIFYYFFTQDIGVGGDEPAKKTEKVASAKKPASKPATEAKEGAEKEVEPKADNTKENKTASTPPAKSTSKPVAKSSTTKKSPKPGSNAPAGEIVEIKSKTGRSYIIIGSFIDQDIANDYAKELSADGKGVKVIFPYGKSKRYRVSVVDFDSYADAMAQIGTYKTTYGEDIWTLKY